MFVQFEDKMVSMEQTVEKLENMNQKLKAECHGYDLELLSQLEQKDQGIKHYEVLQRQKRILSNECRVLQAQRVEMTNKLEELLARTAAEGGVVEEQVQGEKGDTTSEEKSDETAVN